ncbi:class I SAM-dependent methyltransferase [Halobacillus salinarum]|uniref:Class I SAM-dependent methyltransferase n=1 Tax=Halobacillus salinarum TaxID=2932257 RepID=A0ABY4EG02_9BACI|nr:class I SAM-dependent methyltransferase [Halobacillus salinarum]UOQ42920.1 class I SAM-dependent methyltransferase [Halobacillus salinarum]
MAIDFHDSNNKYTYTNRKVPSEWIEVYGKITSGKHIQKAVDIGCGGGVYSQALVELGSSEVVGIDFSRTMLEGAKENTLPYKSSIQFVLGDAYATGLTSDRYDLVLKRALIHHLDQLSNSVMEAKRILKNEGVLIIQDRTPSDCFLKGSSTHIRGHLFSLFPRLKRIEERRRYKSDVVRRALKQAELKNIQETKLWETRKLYKSKDELLEELRTRKGRSILFELDNRELEKLITYIDSKIGSTEPIIEKDRWTIWSAEK